MADPAFILRADRLRAARGVVIARDVSLTASPGDVVAVEGPNGSGKTTLFAAAAGLAHRVEGRELARAFAAHAGGRARAHLATDGLCRRADGVAVCSRRGPGGRGRVPGHYQPVLTQV